MPKNVYIVNPNPEYVAMWKMLGYNTCNTVSKADIVQFTGGEDVSPDLYDQHKHPSTRNNTSRDDKEIEIFEEALHLNKFMVGICRGAQFLHVMSGYPLFQDVEDHIGEHGVYDEIHDIYCTVTSTHHQQMLMPYPYGNDVFVLLSSEMSKKAKHYMSSLNKPTKELDLNFGGVSSCVLMKDVEAVYHRSTRAMCFQPHPEFTGAKSTFEVFSRLLLWSLNRYINESNKSFPWSFDLENFYDRLEYIRNNYSPTNKKKRDDNFVLNRFLGDMRPMPRARPDVRFEDDEDDF
jgi:gamma-glutamyl-gamma-aminobutyrate hydrolase PuuD